MPESGPPVYAPMLVEKLVAESIAEGPLPHAFDTPFRHSEGGDCALKLAMKYQGIPESDPFDLPSTFVAWVGTMSHEKWQEACAALLKCEAEYKVHDPSMLASGSLDLLHTVTPRDRITVEAKIVNGSKFQRAAGIYKRGPASKWTTSHGPSSGHVIQLALNTVASDSFLGVLFYVSTEAVSKGIAKSITRNCPDRPMTEWDRFIVEWSYTREELEPIARAELERLANIKSTVDEGDLPEPYAIGDDFEPVLLDPTAERLPWQCEYCSHLSICPVASGEIKTERYM